MQTSAINSYPIYQNSDTADYGTQMAALVKAIDARSVSRYSSTSAADAAMGAFTAGGGVLADGMLRMIGGWPQVYRGGLWRGIVPINNQTTTFFDTTFNGSAETGVAILNVGDPGHPYMLDVSGAVTVYGQSGVTVNVYLRLDAVAGTLCSRVGIRDGLQPSGSAASLSFPVYRCPIVLTGSHRVLCTVKTTGGSGNWAVTSDGNYLRADQIPA